ncbi:MAG: oligosaccharide flippase family protein [Thermoguttaceae bacterium]
MHKIDVCQVDCQPPRATHGNGVCAGQLENTQRPWIARLALDGRWLPASARQATTLIGGTLASQAILLLATPVLTRIFGPADLGVLAVYLAVLAVPLSLASWRYELAIPLAPTAAEAAALLVLCGAIVLLVAGALGLGMAAFGRELVLWLNAPGLYPYLWIPPIAACLSGWVQAWSYWATRNKQFKSLATTRLSQAAIGPLAQAIWGSLCAGPLGLLAGDLIGRAEAAAAAAWRLRCDRQHFRRLSWGRFWGLMARYRRYPLLLSGSSLVNCLSQALPVALLCSQYGLAVAGCFALSQRVGQYPLVIIGRAAGEVFLSRAREDRQQGRLAATTFKLYQLLLGLGLPFAAILVLAAPELFAVLFGQPWAPAGRYTQLLAPWLLLVFVGSPLSVLVAVYQRQAGELVFQTGLLAGRAGALATCFLSQEPLVPISLFGAVSAGFWLWYVVWLLRVSGNPFPAVLRPWGWQVAGLVPLIAPLVAIRFVWARPVLVVGAACAGGLLAGIRFALVQFPRIMQPRPKVFA